MLILLAACASPEVTHCNGACDLIFNTCAADLAAYRGVTDVEAWRETCYAECDVAASPGEWADSVEVAWSETGECRYVVIGDVSPCTNVGREESPSDYWSCE